MVFTAEQARAKAAQANQEQAAIYDRAKVAVERAFKVIEEHAADGKTSTKFVIEDARVRQWFISMLVFEGYEVAGSNAELTVNWQ